MDIKLIALDLDGTLTNEEKVITPYTYDVLMEAQRQGIRLCLASGRPPYGMRPLAKQLRMAEYGGMLICYNGGHIEDCHTGRVYVEKALDEALFPTLLDFQELSGMTLMTYYEDHIYTQKPDDRYVRQSSKNNNMAIRKVEDFLSEVPRPLNKCLMVGDPEIMPHWERTMKEALGDRMNVMHSTPYFIELLPPNIDKGPSLMELARQLGMTAENVIAFGDSYNDIGMIRLAGTGVAMGNAEDAVKAAADFITKSNEEDGVGDFLSTRVLKNK